MTHVDTTAILWEAVGVAGCEGHTGKEAMVSVVYDLMICQCCQQAVANAESCECPPSEHPDGLAAFKGIPEGVHMASDCRTDPEELDDPADAILYGALCEDFDDHRCNGCGTYMAGSRHRVVGLR